VIVTVTLNPTVDTSAEVDEMQPDEKLRAQNVVMEPGGGGVNVARVLRRFQMPAAAVVAVGGLAGGLIEEQLEAEDVPVVAVRIKDVTRRAVMVFDRATNQQYRIVSTGPTLAEEEWRACLHAVDAVADRGPAPSFIVLSGSMPPGVPEGFVRELAALATRHGARLVVDTSGPALATAVEAGAFLIKPSRKELAGLVHAGRDDLDVVAAATELSRSGVAVVASLGPGGAVLAAGGEPVTIAAPPVEVLSTVGAGDSMLAGILAALDTGSSLAEAVRFGVATGTATCITAGSELCRLDDVRRLAAELGVDHRVV
jgi:6-phosphofructokinase 2